MARLPQVMGRNRAMEVLLSSEDIYGDQAEAYGYVNRTLPDAELDAHVEALATRISAFDKWAIANTKRLGEHEPAGGCRVRRGVGRLHRFARPARRAGRNQGLDSDWFPEAGRRRNPARFPPGSTGALSPLRTGP
jgi:enoyl-CoA hydratase/carnithine racemase